MKRVAFSTGLVAMSIWALPGVAGAGTLECPSDAEVTSEGYTRQYAVTLPDPYSPTSCTFGDGNPDADSFPEFDFEGKSDDSSNPFDEPNANGATSGDFTITDYDATLEYLLVIKDGGSPKWAAFVLPVGFGGEGEWAVVSDGGSLSHLSLYSRTPTEDTPTIDTQVPEPTSLLLLGSGLALAGARLRSRRAKNRA